MIRFTRRGSMLSAVIVVVALLALATACDPDALEDNDSGEITGDGLQQAEVTRVVDGDTIIVRVDGDEERLRYIGIDAPESVAPDQPVECFGPESSDANARLVAGQTVFLEPDSEDRDRFGRLLRYVYVVGPAGNLVMVNQMLVEQGFAEAGFFPPNERYSDDLFDAERRAQAGSAGLWSACS